MNNQDRYTRRQMLSDAAFAFVMGVLIATVVVFWPVITAWPK